MSAPVTLGRFAFSSSVRKARPILPPGTPDPPPGPPKVPPGLLPGPENPPELLLPVPPGGMSVFFAFAQAENPAGVRPELCTQRFQIHLEHLGKEFRRCRQE